MLHHAPDRRDACAPAGAVHSVTSRARVPLRMKVGEQHTLVGHPLLSRLPFLPQLLRRFGSKLCRIGPIAEGPRICYLDERVVFCCRVPME